MAADDTSYTGRADASGAVTVVIRTSGRQRWTVQQVGVNVDPLPAGAKCSLYKNDVLVTPIILASTGGAAGGNPPMMLSHNDSAEVRFTGLTVGQSVTVFVIYDDGQ